MSQEIMISGQNAAEQATEARLIALVLDSVTSEHSRRSYRTGLVRFFTWIRNSESAPNFSKALVGEYRAHLLERLCCINRPEGLWAGTMAHVQASSLPG